MRVLRILLDDANRQEACAVYTADVLGAIAGRMFRMGGAEIQLPLFSDLLKPPEPVQTAEEIVDQVMQKMDKLGARR